MNYQIPSLSVVYKIDLDRYGMWKWAVEQQIYFLQRFMNILERLLKYVTHEEAFLPLFYIKLVRNFLEKGIVCKSIYSKFKKSFSK